MTDPVGYLVEFIENNRVMLALVEAAKKNKLTLLTSTDKQMSISKNRVLLMCPAGVSPSDPRDVKVGYMRKLERLREELAEQVDVEGLWELVHSEPEPLALKDLAELAFSPPVSDDQVSATLRALFNERLHFRLAGGQMLPLSPQQVEAKRIQREREQARQATVAQAVDYLKSLPPEGPLPEPPEGLTQLLVDLVVHEEEAPQARLAKEIVSQAELGGRKRVFDLLVRLGVFDPNENLIMRKEGLEVGFTKRVMAEAEALDIGEALAQPREDLTELYTFTIDGAESTDFDDAISFEPRPGGGGVLGVHITDVAALIPTDGALEAEARARASSIYMPDLRVPMLPPVLSEGVLSLKEGEQRPAVSTLVELDAEGRVINWRITRSVIQVKKRLVYEDVDEMFASDELLGALRRTCEALAARRRQMGAYFLPIPEVIITVDEQGNVEVSRIDTESPSRLMVAETAILANWLAARFLYEKGIPALYRIQAPASEPLEEGEPGDIYLHFRQRRLLNPVEVTTRPGLHASLGLEPYTHVTSPIRRYLDLLMQRQLVAALEGRQAYTTEELKNLAMEVVATVRRGMRVRAARHRYWLLKWLEARVGQELDAIVMELQVRRWQLLLADVMLLVTIPTEGAVGLKPGQWVKVRVERADAFNDVLRVALARS